MIALLWTVLATVALAVPNNYPSAPQCRFSPLYKQSDVVKNPDKFEWDLLYWEGKFHQNNIGYNTTTALTFDGTLLDQTTGYALPGGGHPFSAASKESLHIMMLAHALNGNPKAARWLSPNNMGGAKDMAFNIMKTKLATYEDFNKRFPGFGGYLPWYLQGNATVVPTSDWVNRVPALDNGELIWAAYAATHILQSSYDRQWQELGRGWQKWLDRTKKYAARVFYNGTGEVCDVVTIADQGKAPYAAGQSYHCESDGRINDPYEGELFTWWLYFFGGLPAADQEALWVKKRPKLQSREYKKGNIGPITVQEGFWFSAHEQWKVLEMPYYDVELVRRLFKNAERARTCNAVANHYVGLFASVNNITDASGQITGYISNAGIPSISSQPTYELDVVTPYGMYPVALFDRGVALAWWKNMADGKKMQNPYGSTESTQQSGKAISSFVSWDSKITSAVALLGGVSALVRPKMQQDGIYKTFIQRTQHEYGLKFDLRSLKGENQPLCLPKDPVPHAGLKDYTGCHN